MDIQSSVIGDTNKGPQALYQQIGKGTENTLVET